MDWTIHHKAETVSTNLDARAGAPGDVFTADYQTAGRGRLDHTWLSPPRENLMMSVVLDVAGVPVEKAATLPLVVGLAVVDAVRAVASVDARLKWPNDLLVDGRKLAGILCERHDDRVIAGIGVNVRQTVFPPEIAACATSLAVLGAAADVTATRDAVLAALADRLATWRQDGFRALLSDLAAADCLKGRTVSVFQTDADRAPLTGLCDGIAPDGSLLVDGVSVYAGEAHVAHCSIGRGGLFPASEFSARNSAI